MLSSIGKQSGESVESILENENEGCGGKESYDDCLYLARIGKLVVIAVVPDAVEPKHVTVVVEELT